LIGSAKLSHRPEIARAEKAGFRLAGTSEINANSKDPRNMPVWDLPPPTNTSHAKAIGEADNMTLRFEKPRS
jgi:predicted methyltransferase